MYTPTYTVFFASGRVVEFFCKLRADMCVARNPGAYVVTTTSAWR